MQGIAARTLNLLALLKLEPTILDAIRALPPGTPERQVTERRLRPLTGLSHDEQLRRVARLLPGLLNGRAVA